MTVQTSQVPGGHDFTVWTPGFADWIKWTVPQLYGQPAPARWATDFRDSDISFESVGAPDAPP